jgi:hypothetical protein
MQRRAVSQCTTELLARKHWSATTGAQASSLAMSAQRELKRATGTVALQSGAPVGRSSRALQSRSNRVRFTGRPYRTRWKTASLQLARKVRP